MLLVSMYYPIHIRELPTFLFLEGVLDGFMVLVEMPKESICDISLQGRKDIVYVSEPKLWLGMKTVQGFPFQPSNENVSDTGEAGEPIGRPSVNS